MKKRVIISESEKRDILSMYNILSESTVSIPTTVSDNYTATNCDELHAFQGTGGKVIGNMNVTVGQKLKEIYDSGINPVVTNVSVKVQGMTVSWTVTIDQSKDGKAWVGFTSRGAGCNNDILNRAESASVGNDINSAKTKIESTYQEQGIDIQKVNDYVYNGGPNSFKQVFYRYTKPKSNPPKTGKNQPQGGTQTQEKKISGDNFDDLRTKLKSPQQYPQNIDVNSLKFDPSTLTVSYSQGPTQITSMSMIFDDSGQLNQRLGNPSDKNAPVGSPQSQTIFGRNKNMFASEKVKGTVGNTQYQLVYFQ